MTASPALPYRRWLLRITRPLLVFEAGMALCMIVVLDPLLIALLQALVALGDDPFAGNMALFGFLLSPLGILTVVTAAVAAIFLAAVEFGGVSLIAWDGLQGQRSTKGQIWRRLAQRLPALLGLTAIVFVALLLLVAPVIAAAYAVRAFWLSDADIYFYVTTWPTRFVAAVALVGLVAALSALLAFKLALRWWLSVPICVLRSESALASLRASAASARGRKRPLALHMLGWIAGVFLLSTLSAAILAGLHDLLLTPERSLSSLNRVGILLAFVNAVVIALLACLSRAALAIIAVRFYARLPDAVGPLVVPPARAAAAWFPRRTAIVLLCIALPIASMAQAFWAIGAFAVDKPVAVTAHRAGSARAPENTLAALEQAIADGADYAEIDVQETADGELVLLHDTDLRRVAGLPRSLADLSYDEIKDLDVGSWFDPRFSAERIPTFEQTALAAKGRIKLNVELKVNARDEDLAGRTVAILHKVGIADTAVVSSLDANILRQIRQVDPAIPVGFIVATGVGSLARLDVDFYAINQQVATPGLVRRLTDAGRGVHVWGLGSEEAMVAAILDGADNLIVDDPARAFAAKLWLADLTAGEKALLRLRNALARGEHLLRPARWHAVVE